MASRARRAKHASASGASSSSSMAFRGGQRHATIGKGLLSRNKQPSDANAGGDGDGTNNNRSKQQHPSSSSTSSSSRKLKIKPFVKPPSLPPDFYERTSSILFNTTRAILSQKPLLDATKAPSTKATKNTASTADSSYERPPSPTSAALTSPTSGSTTSTSPTSKQGGAGSHSFPSISREELYKSVEDLCAHKYGPKLYGELVEVIDEAALESLTRLSSSTSEVDGDGPSSSGANKHCAIKVKGDNDGTKVVAVAYRSLPTSSNAEYVLESVQKVYKDYMDYLYFVRSIFLHLDRRYIILNHHQTIGGSTKQLYQPSQDDVNPSDITTASNVAGGATTTLQARPIREVGIGCFRHYMLSTTSNSSIMYDDETTNHAMVTGFGGGATVVSVVDAVVAALLHMVEKHREGQIVDRLLLRNIVRMLSDLHLYQSKLVPPLLETSALYYERDGFRVMERGASASQCDVSGFLQHVETRIDQCNEACVEYLEGLETSCSLYHLEGSGSGPKGSTSNMYNQTVVVNVRKQLLSVIEDHLLKPHIDMILESKNVYPIFSDAKHKLMDVSRLYQLLRRVGYLKQLKSTFQEYAQTYGMEIVQQQEQQQQQPKPTTSSSTTGGSSNSSGHEKVVVQKLLEWKADLQHIVTNAFESQDQFQWALRDALEAVLNVRGSKMSEWLARYVDGILRSSRGAAAAAVVGKSSTDVVGTGGGMVGTSSSNAIGVTSGTTTTVDSIETLLLEEVMVLFRHLHSKDVFEAFYQKDLAKRLLSKSKSTSEDLERAFLSKLKAECGTGYTSKMEGMFKDLELSHDIMTQYSESLRDVVADSNNNMDVTVLTTGYWPQFAQHKALKLPHTISQNITQFETYYNKKYQGRRIHWQYSLCGCTLKAWFPRKSRLELSVTLFQALVLLCFNESDSLTLPQIMTQTGIEDRSEVERLLQSLSLGKSGTRVLIKMDSPEGAVAAGSSSTTATSGGGSTSSKTRKNVHDTDHFLYNHEFTNKLNRIKISTIQPKEAIHNEKTKVHEQAARDRQYLIDAAIVRIMKARKSSTHRDLIGEVMNQIKHVSRPNNTEIKLRIEGLIEREYISRDDTNSSMYHYVA